MYRAHTVGVIVPAYNEVGHVGDVLRSMPAFVDRIYAIDDRSTDDTWGEIRRAASDVEGASDGGVERATGDATDGSAEAIERDAGRLRQVVRSDGQVEAAAATNSAGADGLDPTLDGGRWGAILSARTSEVRAGGRVVPIRHAENRGAGGAIKTGYVAALADGVDVVATIDGDGQMDPGRLPRFLDPIVTGEADYAKGNRFATAGSLVEMPPFRLLGNCMLTGLTRVASGYWSVSDPQNGYTVISTDALAEIGVTDLFEYYGYCNELLVRLQVADATVEDVPMPATYGDEQSHIDYGTYIPKVSTMLLRNFLWRLAVTYLAPEADPAGARSRRYRPEPGFESDGGGDVDHERAGTVGGERDGDGRSASSQGGPVEGVRRRLAATVERVVKP